MATIDMRKGSAAGKGTAVSYGKPIKTVYTLIDLAKAATAKGSALATADVIQAIRLPAGTRVLYAGSKVIEAADVSQLSFSLGTTNIAAAFSILIGGGNLAGSVGTFTLPAAGAVGSTPILGSQDSINITIGTFSGTVPTVGVLAVFADIADYGDFAGANINATDQAGVPQA